MLKPPPHTPQNLLFAFAICVLIAVTITLGMWLSLAENIAGGTADSLCVIKAVGSTAATVALFVYYRHSYAKHYAVVDSE